MRKKCIIIPLISFAIVIVLLRFVFYIGYVPTASMEPTIMAGEKIFGFRIYDELESGDVIVFEHENTYMVKRIAACPGDTVKIRDKTLKVPKDCYYVLGDNSLNSYDSRYWDEPFVCKHSIIAKVIIEYFL